MSVNNGISFLLPGYHLLVQRIKHMQKQECTGSEYFITVWIKTDIFLLSNESCAILCQNTGR